MSAGTWLGAPLLCEGLGAAVGAVGGSGRTLTRGRAGRRREVGASSGTAPAGDRSAVPSGGLRPREPQVLTGMQRGWRLARDDERRGDVGEEEMASLGLRCLRTSCGACGLRDLLAQAARGSL